MKDSPDDRAEPDRPLRVVIVDDDVWVRTGRAAGLKAFADIEVVAVLDPETAFGFDWDDRIDVAMVDAHDPRSDWDRFPGVRVVESIRRRRTSDQTTVIVISGRMLDPMLRLRMAEAGADFYYGHLDAPDPHSLAALLRHPSDDRRCDAGSNAELSVIGLDVTSRPNQALGWIRDSEAVSYFTEAGTQKTAHASRRTLIKVRDEVAKRARLQPWIGDPQRRPGVVTWRDVSRFVNRALGRSQDRW